MARAGADRDGAIVTVTGTRQAAQSAQAIKRNAEQVLDSIVADDIGKFPDKNVAEILGRVPGVQVIRQNGEAGNVVIRGLGGITTLYNGREMFTAAGRSLFLADVPVAMLQRVDVYKSQGADMVEGGTSGVIDVRTNRPFDFKGAQAAFNARGEHRDKADKIDPNVSGLLSNRWKTAMGEIGLLGGLSYQRGRYHDETAFVGEPRTIDRGIVGAPSMGRVLSGGDREFLAGNLSAQWRVSSDLELYAESFSTRIDHDSQSVFFVGDLPINNSGSTINTLPGTNYLGSISNPDINTFTLSSTQGRRDESETHQGAIGAIWKATPGVRVSGEVVRTVSKYSQKNPILDTVMNMSKAISAEVRDGGGYLDYPGTDMTDPANWTMFALFDNHNRSRGAATDWRGDVAWTPEADGFFKELGVGARHVQRDASFVHELDDYSAAPNAFTPNALKVADFPGLNCTSPETGGNYGMNQFYAPCLDYLLDQTGDILQAIRGDRDRRPDNPLSFYSDREQSSAAYIKASFGFDAWSLPIDGTAGLRYVKTRQRISGFSSTNGVVSPVIVSSTTNDVLPSLSLRAHFRQDLIGRLSASKAIERAPFADFNPGLTLFPSTTTTLQLSVLEKVGFGAGDMALNDAVLTRWGRYRPWLLLLAVPYGLSVFLVFSTPGWDYDAKLIWAYSTYILMTIMTAGVGIPYISLISGLTSDPQQRLSANGYRLFFAKVGAFMVTIVVPILASRWDGAHPAAGYQAAMAVMAVVGVLLFVFCFFTTTERVVHKVDKQLLMDQVRVLLQNDQWLILCAVCVTGTIGYVIRGSVAIYCAK